MSSAQLDDEGYYGRYEEASKNCSIHTSKWSFTVQCPIQHVLNAQTQVMAIISVITTYFSHSNYATHHLKEELKKEKDQRGIQVAGATRFSSFSIHARSIARCLHPIQRCLVSGTIKFDTKAVSSFHFGSSDGVYCLMGADKAAPQVPHTRNELSEISNGSS